LQFRWIDGYAGYWSRKFDKLVHEKRLILGLIDKKPVGFLHYTLELMDYPAAYVELVFSSTNPSNEISMKMHSKLGYRKCGFINGIEDPKSREIFFFKNLKS
jgi:hypothetical protein